MVKSVGEPKDTDVVATLTYKQAGILIRAMARLAVLNELASFENDLLVHVQHQIITSILEN